ALGVGNHPRHFFHFLALNSLGAAIVPLNPDHRSAELQYALGHARVSLAVCHGELVNALSEAAARDPALSALPIAALDGEGNAPPSFPAAPRANSPAGPPVADPLRGEVAILYTSGTTGRPKGCVLTNEYVLGAGAWYVGLGGHLRLEQGCDRLLNPLPVFHMNCSMVAFSAVIHSENCLVLPDRFHAQTWWEDCVRSGATAIHYLGIMPPALFKQAPGEWEKRHRIRFALGAGCDPTLHGPFEQRFGFPLVEVWGMTETGRFIPNHLDPRHTDTRAFGRTPLPLQARVVDENDVDVADGAVGELLVRAEGADPRQGFFSGYLYDEAATAQAWRGGWFHTGDVVKRDAQGVLYFVDRKKDMVRRSGENISSAEVEAVLAVHPAVQRVAVVPVPDALRDEEVMAVIVPAAGQAADEATAHALVQCCLGQLAYYKAPGWVLFSEALPVTPTNKIQKSKLFGDGQSPFVGAFDCRALKKRPTTQGRA
ncbi:MAG: AMP-binding protein, partial [Rubrivivax sp.]|nr:AMP-binding protein [Rubrivivax sp.]